MTLLEEIHAAGAPRHRQCSVRTLLDALSVDDENDLTDAINDPAVSHMAITTALRARGLDMHYQRMARHRNGRCSCGPTSG